MIDQRLISENQYLTSLLQSIEQGRRCEAEPWFPKAVEQISKWFFEVEANYTAQNSSLALSQIFKGLPRHDFPGKILSAEMDIPESLASDFDELLEEIDGTLLVAPWVYGKALAGTCAQKDFQQEYISCCWGMVSRNELASESFLAGLAERFRPTEHPVIPQGFLSVAAVVASNPAEYVYSSDKVRFSVALHRWKKEAELVEVWNDRTFQYFPFNDDGLGLLEAARRIDAVQFTELLETLTLPPAIESLLRNFQIEYDFDYLLELLSSAPSMFEELEDGCMVWNRKIVASLILNSMLSHLQGVADALRESPDELQSF